MDIGEAQRFQPSDRPVARAAFGFAAVRARANFGGEAGNDRISGVIMAGAVLHGDDGGIDRCGRGGVMARRGQRGGLRQRGSGKQACDKCQSSPFHGDFSAI